ncbi:MerR family transcriptional regulator [bacterium]|nr:MerR family transcriptional regulator [bacterium]
MDERLNIKAVSRLVGLNEHTIRAWEKRYRAIEPQRTGTGRRTYSMEEVERLQMLNTLVRRGHAISSVAGLPLEKIQQLLDSKKQELESAARSADTLDQDLQEATKLIIALLHKFDFEAMVPQITKAALRFDIRSFVYGVALPLMREVGLQVDTGKLLIAQEHAFSVMLRDRLSQILNTLNTDNHTGKRIALSTPAGDIHEFGIMLSGILAAASGWSVQYLGPNLPPEDLAKACAGLNCEVALVGTTPVPPEELKQSWREYLRDLDEKLPQKTVLWVGGAAAVDGPLPRLKLRRNTHWISSITQLETALSEAKGLRRA